MKKKSKRVKIVASKGTPIPAKDIAEANDRIRKAMRKYKESGFIPSKKPNNKQKIKWDTEHT